MSDYVGNKNGGSIELVDDILIYSLTSELNMHRHLYGAVYLEVS